MDLELPEPLSRFFEASNANDSDDLVACFDANATVHDEGQDIHGLDAIRAWNKETARKFQTQLDPIGSKTADGVIVVTTRVSGTFDGSPVELDFNFKITSGKIQALDIG